jgi:hypothetical protein
MLAEQFRRFGERECAHVSPRYAQLALGIANDPDLLALACAGTGRGQPIPNLLLAAVQYLLLSGKRHRLASFYPAVGGMIDAPGDPMPPFRDFCFQHSAAIHHLLTTRLVQTNEVRRCALTLPALALAATEQPIALIEIGASAGLNLLFDQYGYRYGDQRVGNPESPVQLHCVPHGTNLPPIPTQLPSVAFRIGLDLNPINVRDHDATRWLRALIWPEQTDRAELLERALLLAEAQPPPLRAGDALSLLPAAFAEAPTAAQLCLVHTFTLNQFSAAMRAQFTELIATQSYQRRIAIVSVEWREPFPPLILAIWEHGTCVSERELAICDPHGAWIAWQ